MGDVGTHPIDFIILWISSTTPRCRDEALAAIPTIPSAQEGTLGEADASRAALKIALWSFKGGG